MIFCCLFLLFESSVVNRIRYDTICIFTCAQKLTKGQFSLAHGTETKIKEKLKQKPISSEGTVQAKVHEGSPGGRSGTTGIGFVKQVGFKPGVKERGSCG